MSFEAKNLFVFMNNENSIYGKLYNKFIASNFEFFQYIYSIIKIKI